LTWNQTNSQPSAHDQQLPLLRPELTANEQIYDGQPYWVVKDPISLRYYRFSREEYFIIEQLRHGATLEQLIEAHRNEFNSDLLEKSDIIGFVHNLAARNLLILRQPDRDEILYRTSRRRWRVKLFSQISNFMFFKLPLYDPDKLFDRMIHHVRFFWTRTFLLIYLLLLGLAAILIIRRWNDFSLMFHSYFFTLYNIPMLAVIFFLVKAVHEFGHGLTCKNYGGEVHEMGIMLLVFAPFLYCNITDSWTFTNKVHRLLATAGGILAELMIAALAAILWYYTEPPSFIHAVMFNTVIVCSLSTVLFNANPLLRFDGYYMIMDIIEVPNLRQRSVALIKSFFIRYLLGGHANELPEEHRYRFVFPLYAISAYIYRWFILFAILFMVHAMLKQIRLLWLGRFLVLVSASTMILFPLIKGGINIKKQRESLGISNVRLLSLLAIVVICASVVVFYPFEQHVTLNFILEPARMQWVRTDVAGDLHWMALVQENAWLEAQDDDSPIIVAHLDNPDLIYEEQNLAAQIQQIEFNLAQSRMYLLGTSQIEQLQEHLKTLRRKKAVLQEMIDNLEVAGPAFSGRILSPREQMTYQEGKFLPRGAPLFLFGDTRELTAKVWVPEKTLARIFKTTAVSGSSAEQLGQQTELMLYAFTKEKFHGCVTSVSSHREDNMGQFGEKLALSNKVGGEVITEYDPVTKQEKPIEPVYEVSIKLDSAPAGARPFMSGRCHIACGRSTLYRWGKDSLLRFISPEVRL